LTVNLPEKGWKSLTVREKTYDAIVYRATHSKRTADELLNELLLLQPTERVRVSKRKRHGIKTSKPASRVIDDTPDFEELKRQVRRKKGNSNGT
jgi:hypothetical protein